MDKFIRIKVLNADNDGIISLRDGWFNPSKISSLVSIHEIKTVFVCANSAYEDVVFQTKLVVDGHEYMSDSDVSTIIGDITGDYSRAID